MEENLFGHTCLGLVKFARSAHYACIPAIDESGQIGACDGQNPYLISFCPFCGFAFDPALMAKKRDSSYFMVDADGFSLYGDETDVARTVNEPA